MAACLRIHAAFPRLTSLLQCSLQVKDDQADTCLGGHFKGQPCSSFFLFPIISQILILRTDLLIPQISEKHAELEWKGDGWTIQDKGSRNGTKVNGKPLKPAAKADANNPGVPISLRSPPSLVLLVAGSRTELRSMAPFVVLEG
jgi:hypothetical protein